MWNVALYRGRAIFNRVCLSNYPETTTKFDLAPTRTPTQEKCCRCGASSGSLRQPGLALPRASHPEPLQPLTPCPQPGSALTVRLMNKKRTISPSLWKTGWVLGKCLTSRLSFHFFLGSTKNPGGWYSRIGWDRKVIFSFLVELSTQQFTSWPLFLQKQP